MSAKELETHALRPLLVNGRPITHRVIKQRTRQLAREVKQTVGGDEDVLLITTLNGAMPFAAIFGEEFKKVYDPKQIFSDSLRVKSYKHNESNGHPKIEIGLKKPEMVIGKKVYVLEDIADTLLTWEAILDCLESLGATSIEMIAMLAKDEKHIEGKSKPKFVGIHIPNKFVVGEGLDWEEHYRFMSGIWEVVTDPDEIAKLKHDGLSGVLGRWRVWWASLLSQFRSY